MSENISNVCEQSGPIPFGGDQIGNRIHLRKERPEPRWQEKAQEAQQLRPTIGRQDLAICLSQDTGRILYGLEIMAKCRKPNNIKCCSADPIIDVNFPILIVLDMPAQRGDQFLGLGPESRMEVFDVTI